MSKKYSISYSDEALDDLRNIFASVKFYLEN